MPAPCAPESPGWRHHWPAAVLAVAAALIALWARHHLFPAYSWNRDEPVYLWHVDVLRSGRLTAPDGGFPTLFQPWLSARGDGVLFTQYTLGWPLVLLAAVLVTGSAGAGLLLGAALAVVGTYAITFELRHDRAWAIVASALMLASPILAIQGGVYLSYLFTLGLGLLFGAGLLSGVRRHRPWRLVGAGLLLGWIFMTRPYDAVLWALAFGGYVLVVDRARWRTLVRPVLLSGATALPLVVATLAYNRHVTGSSLQFPITAADPLDTFGFGPKRLMPTFEVVDYGLGKALKGTAKNIFFLPWFLVGSYVGVALAAAGLWRARRHRSTLAALFVGLAFLLGYFVFWGNYLSSLASRISGPIYLIPLYPFVCLLMAGPLLAAWERSRRLGAGLLAAVVLGTVPVAASRFDANRDLSVRQAAWRSSVEDLEGRALVFVADTAPYLIYLNPFSANGPDLDDRILYASDTDASMLDLIAAHPDRRPYLQQSTVASQELGPREDPYDFAVSLTPVDVRRASALDLDLSVMPVEGATVGALTISGPGNITRTFDLGDPVARDQVVHLGVSGATGPAADDGVPLQGEGTMLVTLGYGDTPAEALASPTVRLRLQYRVTGGVVELLLPASAQRYELVGENPQWRHEVTVPELQLAVSDGSPPDR